LFEGIPPQLAERMVPHYGQGAWNYPTVIEVINWLTTAGVAVLGGDVLVSDGGAGFTPTGDNWYLDYVPGQSWEKYIAAANSKATHYIATYPKHSTSGYYFSLTCTRQPPNE
jgi:hypothetical protein